MLKKQLLIPNLIGADKSSEMNKVFLEKVSKFAQEYKEGGLGELKDEVFKIKRNFEENPQSSHPTMDNAAEMFAILKRAAELLKGEKFELFGKSLVWNFVPYDVQLIAGYNLVRGKVIEMQTGEGKTLAAGLALAIMACYGKGSHLVTANDYLAHRDEQTIGFWLGAVGISVGVLLPGQSKDRRAEQYTKDITYGTAQEFVFDYLKDSSLAYSKDEQVQKELFYTIVDEVDSVLIDEARNPLVISGNETNTYSECKTLSPFVNEIVRLQEELCSSFVNKAKENKTDKEMVQPLLYLVKRGAPELESFLELLKEPYFIEQAEEAETYYSHSFRNKKSYELLDELYYTIDEAENSAELTTKGFSKFSEISKVKLTGTFHGYFNEREKLGDVERAGKEIQEEAAVAHCVSQLLKAYTLYKRDTHYIVENNRIIIIDENTGRKQPDRRWADGLHQALEAKEGLEVLPEPATIASTSIQNYFRLYEKAAGMTGTAASDADEFLNIYGLEVVKIPTLRPSIRKDFTDRLFINSKDKLETVTQEIKSLCDMGRPVLVGTVSVEDSEKLSNLLSEKNILHKVLNAKNHLEEATIIAEAGQKGNVTISTNMAGRGTDILLGEGVSEIGGLHVIGLGRNDSRRVDNQLRGRAARQGDPGSSQFFVSLDDGLLRKYGSTSKIGEILDSIGLSGEISHPLLAKIIEGAQKKIERQNFLSRKKLVELDNVLENHRKIIFSIRDEVINEGAKKLVSEYIEKICEGMIEAASSEKEVTIEKFEKQFKNLFGATLTEEEILYFMKSPYKAARLADEIYTLKARMEGEELHKKVESIVFLRTLDPLWRAHIARMEDLAEDVTLRTYAQKNPAREYEKDGFGFFEELLDGIAHLSVFNIMKSSTRTEELIEFYKNIDSVTKETRTGLLK